MATYYSDLMRRPHCVYRAYIGGDLAYVGVTTGMEARISRHRSQKPWWREVDHISEEWFESREEAFAAESEAIRDENPVYNIARPRAVR